MKGSNGPFWTVPDDEASPCTRQCGSRLRAHPVPWIHSLHALAARNFLRQRSLCVAMQREDLPFELIEAKTIGSMIRSRISGPLRLRQMQAQKPQNGNGALACLQHGFKADAAFIPEPFDEKLITAQVGVIWFQVHLKGLPTHVAYSGAGANAIEASISLIVALHELEERRHGPQCRHAGFAHVHHPLNLNVGNITSGDWTSSEPAWFMFDVRIGIFPKQDIKAAQAEIEDTLQTAARSNAFLRNNIPEVVYNGFLADGYALAEDDSAKARDSVSALSGAHGAVTGKTLDRVATTATTDARFFGLYADTPAMVYRPRAEAIHGFNERVELESLRRLTQTTALFVANWCGLEDYRDT